MMKTTIFAATLCSLVLTQPVWAMSTLSDEELSDTQGQALFNLSYLAPGDRGNFETASNVGFYRLGIEAEIEANLNIKKLQLGCGGVNGAGKCDIDIDHVSLSGNSATSAGRVQSDAVLTNPFFEFAIKNPNQASTREVVGFRVSAEKILGLMTFGLENSNTPSGINSLSGYLNIGSATGTALTQVRNMVKADTGKDMTGRITLADILGSPTLNFSASTYNLALSAATANVVTDPKVVHGRRLSSVDLTGNATINPINFAGQMTATLSVIGIPVNLDKQVTGSISGLTATVPITENLGFIHNLPISGNPFSLSLQAQTIHWPGAAREALRGWWLAFEDQIDIGNITPTNAVPITNDVLSQALGSVGCTGGPGINCALYVTPINCNVFSGTNNCFGGGLSVGDVNIAGTNVLFPLNNLQLSAQTFAPNCYGGLKFC